MARNQMEEDFVTLDDKTDSVDLESEMEKVTIGDQKYDLDWLKGTSAETAINSESSTNNNQSNSSHPIFKTISKLNGKINSMSYLELSKCLKDLKLDPSGKKEVLIKRLKNYHKQLHLNRVHLGKKDTNVTEFPFDYVCVIDFEATCDDTNKQDYPHEIIEFPIVLVNLKKMEIEDCFQKYVKPVINPVLSKFCVHLTGITQDKVQNADTFPDVIKQVNEWFLQKQLGTTYKYAIATDGPWDFENFLNLQCLQSGILYPYWARRWIDVRKLFANWFNVRRCGIEKMLGYLGLNFEGQQHCGLDDARNIARILMKLASDGCELKLNEYIRLCHSKFEKNPFSQQTDEQDVDDSSNVEMKNENND